MGVRGGGGGEEERKVGGIIARSSSSCPHHLNKPLGNFNVGFLFVLVLMHAQYCTVLKRQHFMHRPLPASSSSFACPHFSKTMDKKEEKVQRAATFVRPFRN